MNTMQLLDKALELQPAPYWHKKLNLSRSALHNARLRGHVSPAIAGALAEELGEEAEKWIVIAALESERDSACKSRMMRRFIGAAALAGAALAPVGAASNSPAVYYVKSLARKLRAKVAARKLIGGNAPCMSPA